MEQAPYPWQKHRWWQLLDVWRQGRLPHALLLEGTEGSAIREFAWAFSTVLLCAHSAVADQSCGSCKSCVLVKAGTHPDLHMITSGAPGKAIKVDQIRELDNMAALKAHSGSAKCVIFEPAEAMNLNASNSLLKTLEEPAADTFLFLVCYRPSLLAITLRSRCLRVDMRASAPTALAWLEQQVGQRRQLRSLLALTNKGPLKVLEMVKKSGLKQWTDVFEDLEGVMLRQKDPVAVAEQWNKQEPNQIFFCLEKWLQLMIRTKLSDMLPSWMDSDQRQRLLRVAKSRQEVDLFDAYHQAVSAHRLINGSTNVNAQPLLEGFLVLISQLAGGVDVYG
ncbi:MAG: DNA polymerase III subunit delta' C-terminal domain-containing protein [Gammaproteobacteria bacterium]